SPLRGTSSLGVTGFTTPRYPSVLSPFQFLPFFEFLLFFFLPSRVGEGALHEKLLPLCLLPASHGQQYPPRVGRAWHPMRRVVHFGPRCINRPVSQSFWLVCSRGSSERVTLWGLALRVVNVPGGDSERIGSG
ncbi:hypothetical protein AVEN_58475-1, partial [Araneus ventricosus]